MTRPKKENLGKASGVKEIPNQSTWNSPPNSEPNLDHRAVFFSLFKSHWSAGKGIKPGQRNYGTSWDYKGFADAVQKVSGLDLDPDTVKDWLNSERWPRRGNKNAMVNVFFNGIPPDDRGRQEFEEAWEAGQSCPPPNRMRSGVEETQPWVIYNKQDSPGLVELRVPQPQPQNERGSVRIDSHVRVDLAQIEYDDRIIGVGINKVLIKIESDGYEIKIGSLLGERPTNLPVKLRAGAIEFSGPIDKASGCIVGVLWEDDYLAIMEFMNNGERPIILSFMSGRRSFRMFDLDDYGVVQKEVDMNEEQDAIINILFSKNYEKDTLGKIILAKAMMRRRGDSE